MEKNKTWVISELSSKYGFAVENFRKIAEEKGIQIAKEDDGIITMDQIKLIAPSLAFNLRFERSVRALERPKTEIRQATGESANIGQENIQDTTVVDDNSGAALEQANDIISELRCLLWAHLNDEEAISQYESLHERWSLVGNIKKEQRSSVVSEYWQLSYELYDSFQDEIRQHEFEKNKQKKQAIISEAKELLNRNDADIIKEASIDLVRRWKRVPPVAKEDKGALQKSYQEVISKINSYLNSGKKTEIAKRENERPAPQRLGFIKWFDSNKDFGFICSSAFRSTTPGVHTGIEDVYINYKIAGFYPRDNEWLIFTTRKDRGKIACAPGVRRFMPEEEDILLALEYHGENARICGYNKKHERYDVNVLEKIVGLCRNFNAEGGYEIFKNTLLKYISNREQAGETGVVEELLCEPIVSKAIEDTEDLISKVPEETYKRVQNALLKQDLCAENISWEKIQSNLDSLDLDKTSKLLLSEKIVSKVVHGINGVNNSLKSFLEWYGASNSREIFLSEGIDKLPDDFYKKLAINAPWQLSDVFLDEDDIPDTGRVMLFFGDENPTHLEYIKDWPKIIEWLSDDQDDEDEITSHFIQKYFKVIELSEDPIVRLFPTSMVSCAISEIEDDEKYQIIQTLPEDYAIRLMIEQYPGTELFRQVIGEKWTTMVSSLSYVVFDLESDGENIKEFSFHRESNTRTYEGEAQINSLMRALKKDSIIVGHRVKDWDLKILEKKGLKTSSFVWDTLEIEILLNPCRYAYALRTTHNSKDDTELTDRLFWNQLYRLSRQPELCTQLSDFLPESLNDILVQLREPYYEPFFSGSGNSGEQFFQELSEPDPKIVNKLADLENQGNNGASLIVAPKNLWGIIARYAHVRFYDKVESIEWKVVSKSMLEEAPLADRFLQAILLRFIDLSATPTIANLAQYLRLNYFSDELLSKYVEESVQTNISCTNLESLTRATDEYSYDRIVFIGKELEGRFCQYDLPDYLTPADFMAKDCWIPMRMAGANYMIMTKKEIKLLGIEGLPKDVSNVWVERQLNGKYKVCYNFEYETRIQNLKAKNKTADIEYLTWENPREKEGIQLVGTNPRDHFNVAELRVGTISRYRSLYWITQLKMLSAIAEKEVGTPIIYIIDNEIELSSVEEHARSMGFNIPETGTMARRMEKISRQEKGLIVATTERFWEIVGLKEHTRYIYIWDSLSVDKCRMMWNGKMPFGDEADLSEYHNGTNANVMDATPKSCILSTWPTMEFRYRMIAANNPTSRLYILEPYLDDFLDLAEVWGTESFRPSLWATKTEYQADLSAANSFYKESDEVTSNRREDEDKYTEVAMETIRKIFHFSTWKDSQKEVLPAILSRKEDYLISIPTGGGKSVLFQGPALYNSAYTNRLSIVITPLKALMEDQVLKLHSPEFGFYTNVDYISSDRSQGEVQQIYRKIKGGELALLYVTPERFRSRSFLNALQTRIEHGSGLEYFIFDEAHCVSQWGQEFRPDYLNVMKWVLAVKKSHPSTCVAMYSATVTRQIQEDIKKYLPEIRRMGQSEEDYNPIRSHIGMSFIEVGHDDDSRMKEVLRYIKQNNIDKNKSRMILFCRTRTQCEQAALVLDSKLEELGFSRTEDGDTPIGFFHAGMDAEDRDETYRKFKDGEIFILCATKAFGMGMDISNVHYILHYSPPSILEDYLQEVGRAGRDESQYRDAGFSQDRLIPTACLVSKEDFKKAKELLIKSMLSWTNLNEIRKNVLDYIQNIQSVKDTITSPVIVPTNLWKKDQSDNTYTAFKLGMFWLESMIRFKTGFLSPAHINVSINEKQAVLESTGASNAQKIAYNVYKYISDLEKDGTGGQIQVSINDLRKDLRMGNRSVLNAIVTCTKNGWLKLEQTMRCSVTMLRNSETAYILDKTGVSVNRWSGYSRAFSATVNTSDTFTLGIILNAISGLLDGKKLHKEYVIDGKGREAILRESMSKADIRTKTIVKNGKEEKYMLWYDPKEKDKKNIGLGLAKEYRKDLFGKRAKHIFTILQIVPGVSFKSYLDTTAGEVRQSISISDDKWKTFLSKLHTDCVRFLKYVYDKNNTPGQDGRSINWADCIIELGFDEDGYQYLDNIIQVLKVLGYIQADSMLPMGMEVYTTDDSEVSISNKLRKESVDIKVKEDFDLMNKMRKMRLAAMNAFSGKGKNDMNHFISEYFKCFTLDDFFNLVSRYYDESNPEDRKFIASIRDEAIINEENRLGAEQKEIYNSPIDENINVLAGPGSGKTHTLTLRCARLIYRENVPPEQILVLAYNRAVVVELRNRLDSLFGKLGLGRSASRVHVHTFSALAKIVIGKSADEHELSEWEDMFLDRIRKHPQDIREILPNIRYIMIDEFQDITQTRLDAMLMLKDIYPEVKFFTIGDKDQSIYGFDKKIAGVPESTSPEYYYRQLREKVHPHEFSMRTNYRSYPAILKAASKYLANPEDAPQACKEMCEREPSEEYVYIVDWRKGIPNWDADLFQLVEKARMTLTNKDRKDRIEDIAIFFRTNNEVYRGYERLSKLNISNVRIRVQGASGCELYRVREIYTVINYLKQKGEAAIELSGGKTKKEMRSYIEQLMNFHPNWDRFYLDFAYTMILDFLDAAASEEGCLTYGNMADSMKETSSGDDGQIYKIYERYEEERIDSIRQLNIVLTTMHKVKGLEFDAVIITPSFASLPLRGFSDDEADFTSQLTNEEKEELEEEKRLQYVAYTRARKVLRVYRFQREAALDRMEKMDKIDAKLGYSDSNELNKFFLSFLAQEKYFASNDYIERIVRKNDHLTLTGYKNSKEGYYGNTWITSNYYLKHEGQTIGKLASSSGIVRAVNAKLNKGELFDAPNMSGIFVNEVFVWTYEDTVKFDKENNTDFNKYWSEQSKEKGYIYIVDFAGYAK